MKTKCKICNDIGITVKHSPGVLHILECECARSQTIIPSFETKSYVGKVYEQGRQAGLEEAAEIAESEGTRAAASDCGDGSHVVAWEIEDKIRAKIQTLKDETEKKGKG